jgi:adenylate cyclase
LHQVDRWNTEHEFDPPVRVGIGVHAGQVYCGLVGDDTRLEFTVLGDAVNVTARIEEATKQFGTPLLASEAVLDVVREPNRWRVVTTAALRGRAEAVRVFAPHLSTACEPDA